MISRLQAQKFIPAYMRAKTKCASLTEQRQDLQSFPEGRIPFATAGFSGEFAVVPAFRLPGRLEGKSIPAVKARQESIIVAGECGLALQIGESAEFLALNQILRWRNVFDCPPNFPVRVLEVQVFSPFYSFDFLLNNNDGSGATSILGVGGAFDRCSSLFRGANRYYDLFGKGRKQAALLIGEPGNGNVNLDYYLVPDGRRQEIVLFQLTVTISSQHFKLIF